MLLRTAVILVVSICLVLLAPVRSFQTGVLCLSPRVLRQSKPSVLSNCQPTLRSRWRTAGSGLFCQEGALEQESKSDANSNPPAPLDELERIFEERISAAIPAMIEALDAGPGAVAMVDNVLGVEECLAMRSEAVAVTERGLLRGSASAYSTAAAETFEDMYADEPGISASVLTPDTVAGEQSPRCAAYVAAASRAFARVLSGARRGRLVDLAEEGKATDHQLRLTTVAQQVHMDNAFDGVNRRLLTTIYYLNPDWCPEHGGRFIPWPCSDAAAAAQAREAELGATELAFEDLPPEAQHQVPPQARGRIRVKISRKLAPSAEYEDLMAQTRRRQEPLGPVGDRLVAFYSDELLHSVEPVAAPPLRHDHAGQRSVQPAARFAITLWMPAPSAAAIAPSNPAQAWRAQLSAAGSADADPIGGTLQIEEVEPASKSKEPKRGFGGGGAGKKGGGKARKKGRK